MTNEERALEYINKAIKSLKSAKYHAKYGKCDEADRDARHAYRYMKKSFTFLCSVDRNLKSCGREKCKAYVIKNSHNKYIFQLFDCDCHPRPQPFSLTSHKFLAKVSGGVPSGNDLVIPAESFIDDQGHAVVSFPTTYEYATLYINGMIQQNGVFFITPRALKIRNGIVLDCDDPVVVELAIEK